MASVSGIAPSAMNGMARPPRSRRRVHSHIFAPHALALDGYMPSGRGSANALATLVESEIIPRLMLAHGGGDIILVPAVESATIGADEVDDFAPLTLGADAAVLLARIEPMLARGVTVETVLVDLLAPTARRLGLWWEDDRCDFIEVTMGLWRLQEVVRELVALGGPPVAVRGRGMPRRALFAAMPGDQHDFGAIMVGECFRRRGWATEIAIGADLSALYQEVAGAHYDIVGLTVSCDCHSAQLPSVILALRSVSRNPRLRVMVGGRVFVETPELASEVGADGTAPDAEAALIVAAGLVDALEREAVACG